MRRIVDYVLLAVFVALVIAAANVFDLGIGVERGVHDLLRYTETHGCTVDPFGKSYTFPFLSC